MDASFAVYPNFRSHSRPFMMMGDRAIQSILRKQKFNIRNSTKSELVGTDDVSTMVLWTKLFL